MASGRSRPRRAGPRLERVAVGGAVLWPKRAARLRGRFRLTKPSARAAPRCAFDALRRGARPGAPAPELGCAGGDFFLMRDGGASVEALLRQGHDDPEALLEAAGAARAGPHAAGLTHGRPALRAFVAADRLGAWGEAAALRRRHRRVWRLSRPMHGRCGRGDDLRPLGWLFAPMAGWARA
ncbi:MAG: hypothetical protein EA355_11490 [Rhodobacteraceae bacterium]|nr:MAG: hypothetical protein EA355_11490 [Paracoccaceae bacterium]